MSWSPSPAWDRLQALAIPSACFEEDNGGPNPRRLVWGTSMRPELFRFFDVGFPSYFVLLLSGFIFATGLGVLWARRIGLNADVIVDLGLAMLLAGVAGSRILHVLVDGYFWDYVHLCTDPSAVSWPLDRAECVS